MKIKLGRREFLVAAGAGITVYGVVAGRALLSPRSAREEKIPFTTLTPREAADVEALGETILPGAAVAGIAHYLDKHLKAPPEQSLLFARLVNIFPPYLDFYRAALLALNQSSRGLHKASFAALGADKQREFVASMARANPPGWQGPDAPFFYFVLRSDAVDVTYGTTDGFAKLNVPYMPHIMPAERW